VVRQKLKTQFRGKRACHFKHPSDFIDSPAAPPELFLIAVEPSFFPFACLGVGADARRAAFEHPISDRNQKVVRNVNGNGLARLYRKQSASKFATAQTNVLCRAAQRTKFLKK